MLMAAPAILQGYIAALGDWYTWKLAEQIYEVGSAPSTFTVCPVSSLSSLHFPKSQSYSYA